MPTDERYIHLRRTRVPLEMGSFGLIQTTLSNRFLFLSDFCFIHRLSFNFMDFTHFHDAPIKKK